MSEDEVRELASRAIREAAEVLGVDPFRLARFLSDGRIAEVLQAIGAGRADADQVGAIAERLRAFLEQERVGKRDPNGGAANGA